MSARIVPCSASGLPKATRDLHALAHRLQRALGHSDAAHAVMDASRPQPALGNLESAAFAQKHVGDRHAHVLETHFAVAVRGVVIAKDRQHALDFDARRIHGHQNHGLLLVFPGRGIGLAHEDGDLAARIARAGSPPLAAVDHVLVSLATMLA